MTSNFLNTFRAILALVTVLAIIGKPYIPPKTLLIYPAATTASHIYGDNTGTNGSSYLWLDENKNEWRCVANATTAPCGINLVWKDPQANECFSDPQNISCVDSARRSDGSELPKSFNFSAYDGINIQVHYEGKARYLRLYLRSHVAPVQKEILSGSIADDAGKFMSAFLRTEDLKAGGAYVSLSEFSVAEQRVLATNASRELARAEFDKITRIGIDYIEQGIHKMRVERIELTGERITTEDFLLGVLAFWSAVLLAEAGIRHYRPHGNRRARQIEVNNLSAHAHMDHEKDLLKAPTITDELTGAYNKAGLMQHMHIGYGDESLPQNFGVLIIDIDHFKQINNTHGRDTGDHVLKTLTQLVESNIREGDIFARWEGQKFVLIARHAANENLALMAEKIRLLVANHSFGMDLEIHISVSIGVTPTQTGDGFIDTLKRADAALYQAKINRNSVVFRE